MKKVVLWVWVYFYLAVAGLLHGMRYGYSELVSDFEPYFGPVSLLQVILYLVCSVVGVGLLGVWIAVIK